MPELPEVETIRRDLAATIVGRRIIGVTLNWPHMVLHPSPEDFSCRLVGHCVHQVDRRGKYLILRLESGDALILHLRMSGSLLIALDEEPDRYCRAVFLLDDGARLCFRDPRKLGKMWLVEDENSVVGGLGPEPLEGRLTAEALGQRLAGRSAPVKALLCDQSVIAGVGNMYADEALFAAGIHPLHRANTLTRQEVRRLHRALRRVLSGAIDSHGASVNDYWRPDGEPGTAQFEFKVAHRGGKPCPDCGTAIQRIPIRGRGSCFCPRCQKAAR